MFSKLIWDYFTIYWPNSLIQLTNFDDILKTNYFTELGSILTVKRYDFIQDLVMYNFNRNMV